MQGKLSFLLHDTDTAGGTDAEDMDMDMEDDACSVLQVSPARWRGTIGLMVAIGYSLIILRNKLYYCVVLEKIMITAN
jgi:hypothetical protein